MPRAIPIRRLGGGKRHEYRRNPEDIRFFNSREWKALKKLVKAEQHGLCQVCGRAKPRMQADHIKPRSKYPELALEQSNIQMLCPQCHNKKRSGE